MSLYSQKISNDTLYNKTLVKSKWALKIESGVFYHQMSNTSFIENPITQITNITVSYKNFFFTYGAFYYDFKPLKNITFDNTALSNQNKLRATNLNVAFGYIFNFHEKWSSDIKIGSNSSIYEITNSNESNLSYKSDYISGTIIGVGIDRYIKIKRLNYIVVGFDIDYYSTDYSKLSDDLEPSSVNYSLTIGYKGFFRRILD